MRRIFEGNKKGGDLMENEINYHIAFQIICLIFIVAGFLIYFNYDFYSGIAIGIFGGIMSLLDIISISA